MTTATKDKATDSAAGSTALRLLADWGLAETEAHTLGELIGKIQASREPNHRWEAAALIPLSALSSHRADSHSRPRRRRRTPQHPSGQPDPPGKPSRAG